MLIGNFFQQTHLRVNNVTVTVTGNKRSPTFMPGGFDFLISFPVSGITNRAVSTVMYV